MNFNISGDITITIPPSPIFWKKEGGVVIEKFFVKDFLSKNFFGASRRSVEGGVVIVISPDTNLIISIISPPLILLFQFVVFVELIIIGS